AEESPDEPETGCVEDPPEAEPLPASGFASEPEPAFGPTGSAEPSSLPASVPGSAVAPDWSFGASLPEFCAPASSPSAGPGCASDGEGASWPAWPLALSPSTAAGWLRAGRR